MSGSISRRRRTSSSRPARSAFASPVRGAPGAWPPRGAARAQGAGPKGAAPPSRLRGMPSPFTHSLPVLLLTQLWLFNVFPTPQSSVKVPNDGYILYIEVNDDIYHKYSRPKPNQNKQNPDGSCPPPEWALLQYNTWREPSGAGLCNCWGRFSTPLTYVVALAKCGLPRLDLLILTCALLAPSQHLSNLTEQRHRRGRAVCLGYPARSAS